ncbi:hypothetical protein VE03_01181 [Pseudogymnoascus sp. 23342-1-I1]|nr:hypothetical protein VE03_01181 [Pseudogymnoascus sp. 23342-1-I1]
MSTTEFTFGIELEYIVPFIYTDDTDPQPGDRRAIDRVPRPANDFRDREPLLIDNVVYDRVHRTLQLAGLPAAQMPVPKGTPAPLPTQWDTVCDESLVETDEMAELYGAQFVPLEVRSPVLIARRADFRSIGLAVDSMVIRHRLFATDTCGYHVHVGRGTEGFSLPVLKRIAAFLWVFENQLGSLHSKERHTNGYAQSMRKKANISRYANDLRQGIREIFAATTERDLVILIHWTDEYEDIEKDDVFIRNMAYNFLNIVLADGKKTIEFRQFCSTTESLDVKMWAEVCTGIVMACTNAVEGEWINFLHNAATMEENIPANSMRIGALLSCIGLRDQAIWAHERCKRLGNAGLTCSIQ